MSSPSQKMVRAYCSRLLRSSLLQRMRVKALELQKERAERDDDDQQPLEFAKRADRFIVSEPRSCVEAKRVRRPEGEREKQAVDELEELEIEFFFAAEHARGWRSLCPHPIYGTAKKRDQKNRITRQSAGRWHRPFPRVAPACAAPEKRGRGSAGITGRSLCGRLACVAATAWTGSSFLSSSPCDILGRRCRPPFVPSAAGAVTASFSRHAAFVDLELRSVRKFRELIEAAQRGRGAGDHFRSSLPRTPARGCFGCSRHRRAPGRRRHRER